VKGRKVAERGGRVRAEKEKKTSRHPLENRYLLFEDGIPSLEVLDTISPRSVEPTRRLHA
tara:strand:- start:217 stop:396 length:180 start_codon:yes stop_codon:yes gene_type:complete